VATPPDEQEVTVSIKDAEKALAAAEKRARAPFLADVERQRRLDDVEDRRRDLDIAIIEAEQDLAGRGRRRR
jgi:hypothetical protein